MHSRFGGHPLVLSPKPFQPRGSCATGGEFEKREVIIVKRVGHEASKSEYGSKILLPHTASSNPMQGNYCPEHLLNVRGRYASAKEARRQRICRHSRLAASLFAPATLSRSSVMSIEVRFWRRAHAIEGRQRKQRHDLLQKGPRLRPQELCWLIHPRDSLAPPCVDGGEPPL